MTQREVKFSTVEAVRTYANISKVGMAKLLDVTPVTYNNWSKTGAVGRNVDRVSKTLAALIAHLRSVDWEQTRSLTTAQRLDILVQALAPSAPEPTEKQE